MILLVTQEFSVETLVFQLKQSDGAGGLDVHGVPFLGTIGMNLNLSGRKKKQEGTRPCTVR